jgi:hypothetical protein
MAEGLDKYRQLYEAVVQHHEMEANTARLKAERAANEASLTAVAKLQKHVIPRDDPFWADWLIQPEIETPEQNQFRLVPRFDVPKSVHIRVSVWKGEQLGPVTLHVPISSDAAPVKLSPPFKPGDFVMAVAELLVPFVDA